MPNQNTTTEPMQVNQQAPQPIQTNSKSNKKIIFIILGIFGGLLILCIGGLVALGIFGYTSINGAKKAGEQFLSDIKTNDDKAYDNTAKGFKEISSKDEWDEFMEEYEVGRNQGVDWSSYKVENNTAQLVGTLKMPDEDRQIELDLIKVEGEWKVYGFRLR